MRILSKQGNSTPEASRTEGRVGSILACFKARRHVRDGPVAHTKTFLSTRMELSTDRLKTGEYCVAVQPCLSDYVRILR